MGVQYVVIFLSLLSIAHSLLDDVVNERGYVDGVKAAKKNSKGVVLGKAVEYIKYVYSISA